MSLSDQEKAYRAKNLLADDWFKQEIQHLERIATDQAVFTSPANDIGRMELLAEVKAYRHLLAHLETLAGSAISE